MFQPPIIQVPTEWAEALHVNGWQPGRTRGYCGKCKLVMTDVAEQASHCMLCAAASAKRILGMDRRWYVNAMKVAGVSDPTPFEELTTAGRATLRYFRLQELATYTRLAEDLQRN